MSDDKFSGYGVAIRRKEEPSIPGEPFMSMAVARRIAAEMVQEALATRTDSPTDAANARLIRLLERRRGASFDGETHLTDQETDLIIAALRNSTDGERLLSAIDQLNTGGGVARDLIEDGEPDSKEGE